MMKNLPYPARVATTLLAAMIAIPAIAGGFYMTYQIVTYLGN